MRRQVAHSIPSFLRYAIIPAVPRDWNKVTNYCKRLGVVSPDFQPNMSNSFLSWKLENQPEDGAEKQLAIADYQKEVASKGGVLDGFKPQLPVTA